MRAMPTSAMLATAAMGEKPSVPSRAPDPLRESLPCDEPPLSGVSLSERFLSDPSLASQTAVTRGRSKACCGFGTGCEDLAGIFVEFIGVLRGLPGRAGRNFRL